MKRALLIVGVLILALGIAATALGCGGNSEVQDSTAKSLVRNAMTCIESAYVDLRTFDEATMDSTQLNMIEPTISFDAVAEVADVTATEYSGSTGLALNNAVRYTGTESTYAVGCMSESGTTFAVTVDKGAGGGNLFWIGGEIVDSW